MTHARVASPYRAEHPIKNEIFCIEIGSDHHEKGRQIKFVIFIANVAEPGVIRIEL